MSIDSLELEEANPNDHCACQNCDWRGPARDLTYACDFILTPGDPSPAGRCPECDSTAYLDRPKDRAMDAAMELLAAAKALMVAWDNDQDCGALLDPLRAAIAKAEMPT